MPLLKWRKQAEEAAAHLPALLAVAEDIARSAITGEHPRRRVGQGEQFWQYRPYESGDRPQDIDWRQSAKGDALYIKEHEWQSAQTNLFWCASSPSMNFSSEPKKLMSKRDAACVLSLALGILMKRGGERIGLLGGGVYGIEPMGEALLEAQPTDLSSLRDMDLPQNCGMVLCGDFLEDPDAVASMLEHFRSHQDFGVLVQVLDPAEINLPYNGRIVFENSTGSDQMSIENVAAIHDEYCARIDAHISAIADVCRHAGWHYVLHRTNTPLPETLSAIWEMIDRGQTSPQSERL